MMRDRHSPLDANATSGAAASPRVAPLGFYVHVPFCRHICLYCDFYKVALPLSARGARSRYARLVAREIDLLAKAHSDAVGRPLASIYLGGGTPSSLEPKHLAQILDALRGRFQLEPDCEITLEANPETLVPSRAREWKATGFNRLSIGAQSFDDQLLVKIGRGHTTAIVWRALRRARRAGFDNLSLDLMFALPGQTLEQWMNSIEETIRFRPEHISFYGLTLHSGTKFHEMHAAGRLQLPDDDAQAGMYLRARERLIEGGYEHYEISNFALPGMRARHNERYWLGGDWLAAGPSAHSSYAPEPAGAGAVPASQPSAPLRWENPASLEAWSAPLLRNTLPRTPPQPLSSEQQWTEALLLGLRRLDGLDLDSLTHRTGRDLRTHRPDALCRLLDAGFLHYPAPSRLALTPKGLLLADSLLAELA